MQQSAGMSIPIDKKMKNTRRSSALECVGLSNRNGKSNSRGRETDMIVAILNPLAAF